MAPKPVLRFGDLPLPERREWKAWCAAQEPPVDERWWRIAYVDSRANHSPEMARNEILGVCRELTDAARCAREEIKAVEAERQAAREAERQAHRNALAVAVRAAAVDGEPIPDALRPKARIPRCCECRRRLTDAHSVTLGIGPDCLARVREALGAA